MDRSPSPLLSADADDETVAAWDRRMWTRYRLRPRAAYACPRIVAGLRCLFDGRGRCPCDPNGPYRKLLDHARMWRGEFRQPVLTLEPYGLIHLDLPALVAEVNPYAEALASLGLMITHKDYSPYSPGHATLLIISKYPEW